MKERGILFSAPMVRALIAGEKTMTRRIIKTTPEWWTHATVGMHSPAPEEHAPKIYGALFRNHNTKADWLLKCPYGQPGDTLWCRESFSYREYDREIIENLDPMFWYWADGNPTEGNFTKPKPSIHMPRIASRITLELTEVRVELVSDISEADAIAEGMGNPIGLNATAPRDVFAEVWDSINGAGSFDSGAWVWVLSFRKATT